MNIIVGPTIVIKVFLLRHRLWMPIGPMSKIILFLLHCSEKPTFLLSFIYTCDIIWPPAPFESCYLARNLKEVARAWSKTRLRNLPTFKFANLDLDLVDDYVYLGICFNWNDSFVKATKLLHDKASKAMYSLIQKGRRLKLPTDIMLKLFDSCVAPILLYGCEVWGCENTDIIEKVHTKFCKFIFGVSKFSHNMPIYGELVCYPLSITIKQRMVCYWTRMLKSNQHKLNKVMYDILYNLHCKDIHSSGWIKYQSLMGDEIHFLYECPKFNNLRVKYMYSPDIRREPNVFNFVNIMQTNDPVTIGNLAKFILHGLKLYTWRAIM